MHHFTTGNDEAADEILSKYLSNSQRILFQRILYTARTTDNEELVEKLENKIRQTKSSEGTLGKIFSCRLDILTAKENYEEALAYLKSCLEDVSLEHFTRSSLVRLQDGAKAKGITFPYNIPKRASHSSSDSSSDDEANLKVDTKN